MEITTYGLDLAKSVMQLHWVDMETGEIHRKQLKRRRPPEPCSVISILLTQNSEEF